MTKLILNTRVKENSVVELLSPGVGHAEIKCRPGEVLSASQELGIFYQLNKSFGLVMPPDTKGRIISVKDEERVIKLAYGEVVASIDSTMALAKDFIGGAKAKNDANAKAIYVLAPMDGMFYLSTSPSDPPLVKVGDLIKPGQTLGLIEVMKCFYPMKYQGHGDAEILTINIKNAVAVQSGAKLFEIKAHHGSL